MHLHVYVKRIDRYTQCVKAKCNRFIISVIVHFHAKNSIQVKYNLTLFNKKMPPLPSTPFEFFGNQNGRA